MPSKAKDGKGYKSKEGKGPLEPITRRKEIALKRNVISNFFFLLVALDSILREKKATIGSFLDSVTTEKSGLDKDTHRAIGVLLGMVAFIAIVASNLRLGAQAARIGRKEDSVGDKVVDAVYDLPTTLGSGLYRAGASGTKFAWSGASMVVGLAYYIAQRCNLKKRVDKEEGPVVRGGNEPEGSSREVAGAHLSIAHKRRLKSLNNERGRKLAGLSYFASKEPQRTVPEDDVAIMMGTMAKKLLNLNQENAKLESQLKDDRATLDNQGAMISQLHNAVASEKKKSEAVEERTGELDVENARLKSQLEDRAASGDYITII